MSILSDAIDQHYPTSANEPKVHPLIKRSFIFVPTAGMRLAPEILVNEFFREVFYKDHSGARGGKDLNPDETGDDGKYCYSKGERAVIHALRGRRRKSRNANLKPFFAPLYPQIARNAWHGKNRERVIVNFLLRGALSYHFWHEGHTDEKEAELDDFISTLVKALIGQNSSYPDYTTHNKDIWSVAISPTFENVDKELAKDKLIENIRPDMVPLMSEDPLSQRIKSDLVALCNLEANLPRMQWLEVLMTFLRFVLPIWLLSQMRITSLLHSWIIKAVDEGEIISTNRIEHEIRDRYLGILRPTLMPTREIFERTETYIKHRVELNIFMYNLEKIIGVDLAKKSLVINGAGSSVVSIEKLLSDSCHLAHDLKKNERFIEVADQGDLMEFLTREGEQFHAWRDPLNKGQGKNIDEFFRVLYRDHHGDEAGGYLLASEGRGKARGFRLFPGQMLLKTISFLAAEDKKIIDGVRGGGTLVLQDVEDLFRQYGIDFNFAADARPLLMEELFQMGLLTGSPDAGGSVAVTSPY